MMQTGKKKKLNKLKDFKLSFPSKIELCIETMEEIALKMSTDRINFVGTKST